MYGSAELKQTRLSEKAASAGNNNSFECSYTDLKTSTVKTENCAVVLLCVVMDDTPTIGAMWIFLMCFSCIFVYKNAGVQVFHCAVNQCPHV